MGTKRLSVWKRLRYRCETGLFRLSQTLLPLIPRAWMLRSARSVAHLAYWVDRRGRTTALENLKTVFGDRFSERERVRVARKSYENLGISVFELIWSRRINADNYQEFGQWEFDGASDVGGVCDDGAIWVTPHFGNFEMMSILWGYRGRPISIVAENFKNPALTPIFSALRGSSGHRIIPQERAMVRLLKILKKGGQVAFLSDLTVQPDQASTVIDCFGMKTSVTILAAVLAKRTGLPIVGSICFPESDGRYRIKHFEPWFPEPDMSDQVIAQRCWDTFEPFILEQPEHWIWMYKHWRYLPPGGDRTKYPAYARERKAFSELVRKVTGGA